MNPLMNLNRTQSGLTIIEILISVLIISIGLLGVAGLHAYSLRNNYDALMRSHASALASDIADRMRANRTVALSVTRDYNIKYSDGKPAITGTPPLSSRDKNQWLTSVEAALPNGDGEVDVDPATRLATIRIHWGERDDDPNASTDDMVEFVTETEI
jgi:type IV pilus assembly protein PilV